MVMSESLDDLRERLQRWRSASEHKGLKVNVGKTKMMVSGTQEEIVLSKIDPCGICEKRVGSNAVCCTVYEVDAWEMLENQGRWRGVQGAPLVPGPELFGGPEILRMPRLKNFVKSL